MFSCKLQGFSGTQGNPVEFTAKIFAVYYCQVFTIYHVIYAVIANFGKQQKVY